MSQHPVNFGDHRRCGSGDTLILVCQVILKDCVIKGSLDFMGRSPSGKPITVGDHHDKIGGHDYCDSGYVKLLFCQVTSKDHVIM